MKASEISSTFEAALANCPFFKGLRRFYDMEEDFELVEEQKEATDTGGGEGVVIQGFLEMTEDKSQKYTLEMDGLFYFSVMTNVQAKLQYESQNPRPAGDPDDWRGKTTLEIAEKLLILLKTEICDCHKDVRLYKNPLVRVDNMNEGDGYLQWDVIFNVRCRY